MESNSGYTVDTVLTALHQAIQEQQTIVSTAQSEDTGIISQAQEDLNACMELSENLVKQDPGSIMYQTPLRPGTARNQILTKLQSFVSTPIPNGNSDEGRSRIQTQPIRNTVSNAWIGVTGTIADRIQKFKARSRSPTVTSDASKSQARPRDFPDNAPKVQQHI